MSEMVEMVDLQAARVVAAREMNQQARNMILALVDHATENLVVVVPDELTENLEEEAAFLRELQSAIQNRIDAVEYKRRQRDIVPSRVGKRSNPEFEPTTIFMRKTTKKTANRTLEDTGAQRDLSELIESLLQGWISKRA